MKIVLTIAGSDSGAGAGIQADLKTFHAHGVYGTTVVTSVTAQNTQGVRATYHLPADILRAQLECVFSDFVISAVKIGMLPTADHIRTVSDVLRSLNNSVPVVLDPVMVATSGDRLVDDGIVEIMKEQLLPLTMLLTPNRQEAEVFTGTTLSTVEEMSVSARMLCRYDVRAALIKGGHIPDDGSGMVTDVLFDGTDVHCFSLPRIPNVQVHGTGCTLSSSIAAHVACGATLHDAVAQAGQYVHNEILHAVQLGNGSTTMQHAPDTC